MSQDFRDPEDVCRSSIRQVFEYLKALNDHRNPVVRQVTEQRWMLWLDDLPTHPSLDFQRIVDAGTDDSEEAVAPGWLLRVGRPRVTHAPPPPSAIKDWLQPGWDNPLSAPEWLESREQLGENDSLRKVRFDEAPQRIAEKAEWLRDWEAWSAAERPARRALQIFEKLYALHAELQREAERYDLVIADGLLSWEQTEGAIYHPLILQRVQLQFDSLKPEFTVVDGDFGSELYTQVFQSNAEVDPQELRTSRLQFEAAGYHPLSKDASSFLTGFVHLLSPHGEFVAEERPLKGAENPTIGRAPVLYVRDRSRGFGAAIEHILEGLNERTEFPEAVRNIVGCGNSLTPPEDGVDNAAASGWMASDILFGKEANPEQRRIAEAIDRHGAVLVQGPPGTGKSHTIANLIGHLLAHGQSVLVTSHTTKALRVLRNHLVENLQPLCVSVLESDSESRSQLEQAVNEISKRLSESDAKELRRAAAALTDERRSILDQLVRLQNELRNARYDEYREVVVAGQVYAPVEAAKFVASGAGIYDWIPGPLAAGEPCPISMDETIELYGSNSASSEQDDQYVEHPLPEHAKLPDPVKIKAFLQKLHALSEVGQFMPEFWQVEAIGGAQISEWIKELRALITGFDKAILEFQTFEDWQLEAVNAGRTRQENGCPWEHLLAKIAETAQLADAGKIDFVRYRPEVEGDLPIERQFQLAQSIQEHLEGGKSLSTFRLLLRPSWRRAIVGWKVLGRSPAKLDEMIAVARLIELKIARDELAILWDGLVGKWGGPKYSELGDEPEYAGRQFSASIAVSRHWWHIRWFPLEESLGRLGFDVAKWREKTDLPAELSRNGELKRAVRGVKESLLGELIAGLSRFEFLVLEGKLKQFAKQLATYERPEVVRLLRAIEAQDTSEYERAFVDLSFAIKRRDTAIRRNELLVRLERKSSDGKSIAPMWASAIRRRAELHGMDAPPTDVELAWRWRQLYEELERRSQADLEKLGVQIDRLNTNSREVTNTLIDHQAWAAQLERVTLRQRQALVGWLQTIQRIGRGFGKRVASLRLAAQQLMQDCRDAVPVWIMPLARVAENFDLSQPRFDVVVIDEASQCDAMALLALMAARNVVVVGDDKQVSPLAVGQKDDIVKSLVDQHLQGIPNKHLYDGRMSVYDLALQSFSAPIFLSEHFRCVPDIIEFSNDLCYQRIKPLREPASSPFNLHVVPHRVNSFTGSSNKVNRDEAAEIASLIVAAIERDEYDGQSFGVISLVGEEQAREIDMLLRHQLPPDEYEKRRMVCGSSAHFQGDERDVMFLSVVDTPGEGPLSMRRDTRFEQRFNVAASRARNQMWVVYSLDPAADLQPGDLRRRLIEHAIDPKAVTRNLERLAPRTQSPFEKEVLELLLRAGYHVTPQWPVGRYRIDMVVEGDGKRLAIECDGDRFHTLENLGEDMERQAILERLKWRFVRIRGSVFYRNKEATMQRLFQKLEQTAIQPEGMRIEATSSRAANEGLISDLIRRAAELRAEWQSEDSSEMLTG